MTWTVYTSLRESILNGALPPGESLSQVQLASQLGVSRGPLREAVRMLQREGLVEAEVNRRGRVSSFSIDDLEQLYAMRIVHESLAIRINVPRFVKRDIDALRGCLRRMEALAGHDLRQWQARRPRIPFHPRGACRRSPDADHPRALRSRRPLPLALHQRRAARACRLPPTSTKFSRRASTAMPPLPRPISRGISLAPP